MGDTRAAPAADLPTGARCQVHAQDVGDLRVKLAWTRSARIPLSQPRQGQLQANDPEDGDDGKRQRTTRRPGCCMAGLPPPKPRDEFGLTIPGAQILLLRGEGRRVEAQEAKALAERLRAQGHPLPRTIYGQYPIEPKQLAEELNRDLPRRSSVGSASGGCLHEAATRVPGRASQGLTFQVARLENKKRQDGRQTVDGGRGPCATETRWSISNWRTTASRICG